MECDVCCSSHFTAGSSVVRGGFSKRCSSSERIPQSFSGCTDYYPTATHSLVFNTRPADCHGNGHACFRVDADSREQCKQYASHKLLELLSENASH